MGAEHRLARAMLQEAHQTFVDNLSDVPIEQALRAAGGYRSIVGLAKRTHERWLSSVEEPADLDLPRPVHWGGTAPLSEIVAMMAGHHCYHAGEINMILAIDRGEAWEYSEEVEENHISTAGHGLRPPWMTDEQAAPFER